MSVRRKIVVLILFSLVLSLFNGCTGFKTLPGDKSSKAQKFSKSQQKKGLQEMDMATGTKSDFIKDGVKMPTRPKDQWEPIKKINFPTIYFAYDRSRLGTSQLDKIEKVANFIKKRKNIGVIIEGHCDERGTNEYNIALGERRALAVRDYMLSLGVPNTKIQTISYGSEKPAVDGHNPEAWAKNRRCELVAARM